MKITYKGVHHDLPLKLQEKVDQKFAKLAKLLDGRAGEQSAHVIVTQERHLQNAEITLQYYDHKLVGAGSDGDLFNAMSAALAKLEKQAVKQSERWRARARRPGAGKAAAAAAADRAIPAVANSAAKSAATPRIFRPRTHERRKPITLDEAMLQMEDGRAYMVYRDASQEERLSMLIRRPDGHFDLIEC